MPQATPSPQGQGNNDLLQHAREIQERASAMGFDWPDANGVLAKIREETEEIQNALTDGNTAHAASELGDLLFASVNLARFLHTTAEKSLEEACARFQGRFQRLCDELAKEGKCVESCSLDELDTVWEKVKVLMHQSPKVRG